MDQCKDFCCRLPHSNGSKVVVPVHPCFRKVVGKFLHGLRDLVEKRATQKWEKWLERPESEHPRKLVWLGQAFENYTRVADSEFGGFLANLCQGIDRKSTRLNSSHQLISYAVFC